MRSNVVSVSRRTVDPYGEDDSLRLLFLPAHRNPIDDLSGGKPGASSSYSDLNNRDFEVTAISPVYVQLPQSFSIASFITR